MLERVARPETRVHRALACLVLLAPGVLPDPQENGVRPEIRAHEVRPWSVPPAQLALPGPLAQRARPDTRAHKAPLRRVSPARPAATALRVLAVLSGPSVTQVWRVSLIAGP